MIDHGLNKKQLQSIQSIISDYVSVIDKVVIFGSRATGTYKNYSDIDLVLYGKIEEKIVDRLWTNFYESNLPYKVDIHSYELIKSSPLKNHIDTVGKVLFDNAKIDD